MLVSNQTSSNAETEWITSEPGVALGYQRDAAGIERLIGVLVYHPTAKRVKGLNLRQCMNFKRNTQTSSRTMWTSPPTLDQIDAEWENDTNVNCETANETTLTRISGEPAFKFYLRVASAYRWLSTQGRTPTRDIAEIAQVQHTTAAKWVREARIRGILEPTNQRPRKRRKHTSSNAS